MIPIYLLMAFSISIILFFNTSKILNTILVVSFNLIQVSFAIYAFYHKGITDWHYFNYDSLGILLLLVLAIITIPATIHSFIYFSHRKEFAHSRSVYFAALVLLITAISAGYLANHIAVTWIFTELTTLSASALIYHHRSKLALESTWKYVFICAISVTFVFIGILFLSLSLQHAGSDDLTFKNLLINANKLNIFWLKMSFIFIFTGFTAKLGIVPMFTAGIDAKDEAPAPAGALLASVLMNLGFVGIFRFYEIIANTLLHSWANNIIGLSAMLSIFIATVYMIKVKNIKRMFAYSGLEHMGIVMIGIAAGGVGYYAAILHVVLHAFIKSSLFFQYSQLNRVFNTKNIYFIGNYFKYNSIGAIVLLFGFISATAMPPSGLFISEFFIFKALFDKNHLIILIIILLLLTMIIWAFSKNLFKILFIPVVDFNDSNVPKFTSWESLSQVILLFLAVYLGFNPPEFFTQLLNESILYLPH